MTVFPPPLAAGDPARPHASHPAVGEDMRAVARKLEAAFLAEMLKSAGLGETPEAFGGGAGEDQFASFLRQAQAERMVAAGGIGLAESIFRSLEARAHGG